MNFSGNENEDLIANTVAKQNRKRRKSSAAVSNQKQREKLFEYHPMSIALEFSRQGTKFSYLFFETYLGVRPPRQISFEYFFRSEAFL